MSPESIQALITDCRKATTPTPEMGEETRTTLGALAARLNVIVQEVEAAANNATVIQSAHWEAQRKEVGPYQDSKNTIGSTPVCN